VCDVHIVGTPTFDDAEARASRARIDTEDAQLRDGAKRGTGASARFLATPATPGVATPGSNARQDFVGISTWE